jgi:hypothetical protein
LILEDVAAGTRMREEDGASGRLDWAFGHGGEEVLDAGGAGGLASDLEGLAFLELRPQRRVWHL